MSQHPMVCNRCGAIVPYDKAREHSKTHKGGKP